MKYRKEVDDLDFKLNNAETLLKGERSKVEDLESQLRDKSEIVRIFSLRKVVFLFLNGFKNIIFLYFFFIWRYQNDNSLMNKDVH